MPDLVVSSLGSATTTPADAYCSVDDVKVELRIEDASEDAKLAVAVAAASRQIDGWCGWRFWQDAAPAARQFYADDPRSLYLFDDPSGDGIASTVGLVVTVDTDGDGVYETTLTIDRDFVLGPRNAAARVPAWPYTELHVTYPSNVYLPANLYSGRPGVQIIALWGWPAIPDDVTKACLIQSAQLFKAKDAAFGVAGFGDLGVVRVKATLNPLAEGLLARYRKPAVG